MAKKNSNSINARGKNATAVSVSEAALPTERKYTQSELYTLLGGIQTEAASMLRSIHATAVAGHESDKQRDAALFIAERFAREAFLEIDDALESVGLGRMGSFDGEQTS